MKKGKKNVIEYVTGSVGLFVAACIVLPKVMTAATGMLYKFTINGPKSNNDRNPDIKKKRS